MEKTDYNGWKNKATWLVNVHLTNNKEYEILLKGFVERAQDHRHLVTILQDHLSDMLTNEDRDPLENDLLTYAFYDVDWYELADHYFSEYGQEDPCACICGAGDDGDCKCKEE